MVGQEAPRVSLSTWTTAESISCNYFGTLESSESLNVSGEGLNCKLKSIWSTFALSTIANTYPRPLSPVARSCAHILGADRRELDPGGAKGPCFNY